MEIKAFTGMDRNELSMIEVAHAILEEKGSVMDFSDLANQIQQYLGKADSEIREILPQFYTDLNIDGSFISLGDNRWGLRSWYPIDSIDEEVSQTDEDEDMPRRKKRKKVNAFITGDEDAIDYNDDDPEDTDLVEDDEDYDDDIDDDDEDGGEDISEYTNELQEIGADDDDVAEDEVEGLTIVEDTDLEEFQDEDDEEEEESL